MSNQVRLADVADLAGVSVATASAVSRGIVDGPIRVGDQTRRRVEEAIDELGYRPNAAARALRTQRTGMVGLIVPDITNPIFPQIVRAAQLRAESAGFVVATWDTGNDRNRELAALEAILDRQFDGAVLVTDHLTVEDLKSAIAGGVAIAATDERLDTPEIDLVSEDLQGGAAAAVQHLIDSGHRRIAHITGNPASTVGAGRQAGYRRALADAGIAFDPSILVGGSFERSTGHKGALQLLDLPEIPTAVFAANDTVAIGVLHACAERGVSVPEQMAVIGVDNTPEADAVRPGLTTMDVRPAEVGERLVELVSARCLAKSTRSPSREIVLPTLVRRETV